MKLSDACDMVKQLFRHINPTWIEREKNIWLSHGRYRHCHQHR